MDNTLDIARGLPEEALKEFARIIVAWSAVEAVFDMVYFAEIIPPEVCAAGPSGELAKRMSLRFGDRCKILKAHWNEAAVSDELKADWERALNSATSLARWRNLVAHARISPAAGPGAPADAVHVCFLGWGCLKPKHWGYITTETFKKHRVKINELWHDLIRLQTSSPEV